MMRIRRGIGVVWLRSVSGNVKSRRGIGLFFKPYAEAYEDGEDFHPISDPSVDLEIYADHHEIDP